jgi:hypothetical protein
MNKSILSLPGLSLVVVGLLGCSGGHNESQSVGADPSGQSSRYVVSTEPSGAIAVGDARQSVQDKDEIVLVGRVGGSSNPFVDGIAAFTIVDLKVPHCAADEGCPTPWDYCCTQDQVKGNIAMVKVVDEQGKPVAEDARQLLGVEALDAVVIHGKATRDADGNLALLADQVFVRE